MKTTFLQAGVLLCCAVLASCNSNTSSNSTNAADSTVTTTTTTTHRYMGTFQPQANMKYMDLKTQKQVSIRVDTTTGMLVNAETSEPMNLFVSGTDTIYGQTGTPANNYITRDESGNYSVDESRMNSGTMSNTDNSGTAAMPDTTGASPVTADAAPTGKEKYKQHANGNSKLKTADEKIKDRNGVEKVKER